MAHGGTSRPIRGGHPEITEGKKISREGAKTPRKIRTHKKNSVKKGRI
jgi:hypothetical protein